MDDNHTHEYDCIVCGAHFDNSKDLSRHNEQAHLKNAQGMEQPRQPGAHVEGSGPLEN
ncbi:MAG TPA: hypothetical protein VJ867_03155 [Gemmatimonadaceae bacterium]|nr:hypothetical protein [Gemmatimonadaceae bacterium]